MSLLLPPVGIAVLIAIGWAISTDRRRFPWRMVGWGLGLQVAFAFLVLRTSFGAAALATVAGFVDLALSQANAGIELLFGPLADQERFGVILAISALPAIVYIASVFAVLYYFGVLQALVAVMARVMTRTLGTSGAETLGAAANVFMGQTEAPLVVRPYLNPMTRSELHAVMVSGMATVSGGMLAAYVALGVDSRFLLAASLVNAPAALMMAKIIVPETGAPKTAGQISRKMLARGEGDANVIDAAARGAGDGMKLVINVVAMVIAFLSLVALIDLPLGLVGLSLTGIVGWVFAPVAFLMGVPAAEAQVLGGLIGKKLILNEFVAYLDLAELIREGALSARTELMATFALCGFANLGSVGVQIGGIGALAPERKSDLARLGVRALAGGTLATLLTATLAGMLFGGA